MGGYCLQHIETTYPWDDNHHKDEIAKCIRKFGSSASISILDADCHIFKTPEIEGVIGYRLYLNTAVVLGDPLTDRENMPRLARAFHEYCDGHGWNYIYLTATKPFADWAIQHDCKGLIEVGSELIIDTNLDLKKGKKGRRIRSKVNSSRKSGTIIEEYQHSDPELEEEIQGVAKSWLQGRKGPQIYLTQADLFQDRHGKRWFYAKNNHKIVGVALIHELTHRKGYVLQFCISLKNAPQGTSEHLATEILHTLKEEGHHSLSFGVAQSSSLGEIIGFGKFFCCIAKICSRIAAKLFHLGNRRRYWSKFQPREEKSYLLFSHNKITLSDLMSLSHALNISF